MCGVSVVRYCGSEYYLCPYCGSSLMDALSRSLGIDRGLTIDLLRLVISLHVELVSKGLERLESLIGEYRGLIPRILEGIRDVGSLGLEQLLGLLRKFPQASHIIGRRVNIDSVQDLVARGEYIDAVILLDSIIKASIPPCGVRDLDDAEPEVYMFEASLPFDKAYVLDINGDGIDELVYVMGNSAIIPRDNKIIELGGEPIGIMRTNRETIAIIKGEYRNKILRIIGNYEVEELKVENNEVTYGEINTATTGDVDGDGEQEIVINAENRTHILKRIGATLRTITSTYTGKIRDIATFDIDHDEKEETIIIAPTGERIIMIKEGKTRTILNGDKYRQIEPAKNRGAIYALGTKNLHIIYATNKAGKTTSPKNRIIVEDITGDGIEEIIGITYRPPTITKYTKNHEAKKLGIGTTITRPQIVAKDIDNDKTKEIMIIQPNKIIVVDWKTRQKQ